MCPFDSVFSLNSLRSQSIKLINMNTNKLTGPFKYIVDYVLNPSDQSWKILIMDDVTIKLLAPFLSISSLRDYKVTMHLRLNQPRDNIPDAVAYYFIQPTTAYLDQVAEDIKAQKYDKFHLIFSSPSSRKLIEDFAKKIAPSAAASSLLSVSDTPFLFRTHLPNYFTPISDDSLPEALLYLSLAHQLNKPIFISNNDSLLQKTVNTFDNFLNLTSWPGTNSCAVVLLSQADIAAASCIPPWCYAGLVNSKFNVHDCLVDVDKESFAIQNQDAFWAEFSLQPFDEMASASHDRLKRLDEKRAAMSENLANLSLTEISDLKTQREQLSNHTSIGFALLEYVKKNSQDTVHAVALKAFQSKRLTAQLDSILIDKKNPYQNKDIELDEKTQVQLILLAIFISNSMATLDAPINTLNKKLASYITTYYADRKITLNSTQSIFDHPSLLATAASHIPLSKLSFTSVKEISDKLIQGIIPQNFKCVDLAMNTILKVPKVSKTIFVVDSGCAIEVFNGCEKSLFMATKWE